MVKKTNYNVNATFRRGTSIEILLVMLAIACITPLVLLGCNHVNINAKGSKQSFVFPKDSWYKSPRSSIVAKIRDQDYLKESEFCVVVPTMQMKAINLLQTTSIIRLDRAKATLFCGNSETKRNTKSISPKGLTPYLVRGLVTNELTGAYSIISLPHTLWVNHGSLGKKPQKMKRQALVVFLKQQPKQVFVTSSVVE